jgi:hypothetical protein
MTSMATGTIEHANGTSFLRPLPLSPSGPALPWPRAVVPPPGARLLHVAVLRRQDEPSRGPWRPRLRAVDGDTVITWAMAATVALVAVDAAIVSYSHIYGLATGQWGNGAETGVQARLLPLSIDGVIAEASLVKLYAARHKLVGKTGLATFMLWLGITATVAANVTHGLPASVLSPHVHDWIGALLSAWPAGAFIGSVEMAMGLVRSKRTVASGRDGDSDTEDDSENDSDTPEIPGQGGGGGKDHDKEPPARPRRKTVARRPKATGDPVKAAIKKGWTDDKIIAALGVTKRTVQRHRKELKEAAGPAAP